jgi:FG-GAP-like repeat/FG-GAP repeat
MRGNRFLNLSDLHLGWCGVVLVVTLSASSAQVQMISFSSPVNYPVGTGPLSVASGDFNGDGKLDSAVANGGSSDISILLGKGDGTFQTAVNYALNQRPTFVVVGEFNSDSRLDLAAGINGSVAVLLGNGDGTFQPAAIYPAGNAAEYLVPADFNGDGRADLLASDHSGSISILLGDGDGTFQSPIVTATPGTTAFVALGDFNRDGSLDVATGNGGISHELGFGKLIVLLGNGDGTFQLPVTADLQFRPIFLTAFDLNGDGKLDLAVAATENIFGGDLRIFWGNGDGTFSVSSPIRGLFSSSVAVADVNRDGTPDLIGLEHVDPQSYPMEIEVMVGDGKGAFQDAVSNPCSQSSGCIELSAVPSWLATADLNGDGAVDLIVANPGTNNISVLLNSQLSPPDFSLSASGLAPPSVTAGQSATGTVAVNPSSGFNSTVSFSCSVQPSPLHAPTCAVAPSGSGASVTAMTTAPALGRSFSGSSACFYALWFPLVGIVSTTIRVVRKNKKGSLGLLICAILLSEITFESACGGNGTQTKQLGGGTPPGNYRITVTGTSGSLQHSTSFALTVQ